MIFLTNRHNVPMKLFQKKDKRDKSPKANVYIDLFLKDSGLKARQPVYISKEIHAEIKKVVNLLALTGKEMSVGGYINNVLSDHLEQYKEDIDDLHQKIKEL